MNLLRLKRSLKLAESGREILEKKRDVLMVELRNFAYDMQRIREELSEILREIYSYIEKAAVHLGFEQIEKIAESTSIPVDFSIDYRSVMGVIIPTLKVKVEEVQPNYGFFGTNVYLDLAFIKIRSLLDVICKLAELEESVYRIANAIESTQRRVNALKQIHIPRYRELIRNIESILEEREREEFVRMKKIKSIIERRRSVHE